MFERIYGCVICECDLVGGDVRISSLVVACLLF